MHGEHWRLHELNTRMIDNLDAVATGRRSREWPFRLSTHRFKKLDNGFLIVHNQSQNNNTKSSAGCFRPFCRRSTGRKIDEGHLLVFAAHA